MNQFVNNPWTEERVAQLRALWNLDGVSAQHIANQIGGVTRCAVIGKARRLHPDPNQMASARLPPMTAEQLRERRRAMDAASARRRRSGKPQEARNMAPREYRTVAPPPVPMEPAPVYADSRSMTFDELEYGLCKFPTTPHHVAPDAHRFCGREAYELTPYCLHHHELATSGGYANNITDAGRQKLRMLTFARNAKNGQRFGRCKAAVAACVVLSDES